MGKIIVLYYSSNGKTAELARHVRSGILEEGNNEPLLRTVASLNKNQVDQDVPIISKRELEDCNGLALGSPTRFGTMAAALKSFLETTSDLWLSGALIDKPAAVFTSTSSLHGGQESTLLSMALPLLHHGMTLVGVPYSCPELFQSSGGGSPYGGGHVSGSQGEKPISKEEIGIARYLGFRLSTNVTKLR